MADEELSGGTGRAAPTALETGSGATEASIAPAVGKVDSRSRVSVPETAALAVVLVVLFVFFSITSPYFLNADNLVNILQNVARIGIVACPATMLLISGQFDLSVGSIAAFTGMLIAVLAAPVGVTKTPFAMGLPLELAFVIALLGALLVGLINAFSVTVLKINALITTLATLAIFRGLTKVLGRRPDHRASRASRRSGTARIPEDPGPRATSSRPWSSRPSSSCGTPRTGVRCTPSVPAPRRRAWRASGPTARSSIGFVASGICVSLSGLILLSQVAAAS